jgi:hypothetical protein
MTQSICVRVSNLLALHHAGLLHKKSQEGTQTTMEATLATQQTPQQREQVRPDIMRTEAATCFRRAILPPCIETGTSGHPPPAAGEDAAAAGRAVVVAAGAPRLGHLPGGQRPLPVHRRAGLCVGQHRVHFCTTSQRLSRYNGIVSPTESKLCKGAATASSSPALKLLVDCTAFRQSVQSYIHCLSAKPDCSRLC